MTKPKPDRQRAIDEIVKKHPLLTEKAIRLLIFDAGYQAAQNCPNCGKIEDRPNEDCNPRTTLTD